MTKRPTARHLLPILALMLALPASAATYRWVDENGQVHFGDTIPPEYAKQQKEELNEQGFTVRTIEKAKSVEELEAERLAKIEQEKRDAEIAEQRLYEQRLLTTYETEAALLRAQEKRVESIESQLTLARGQLEARETILGLLQQQAAERERAGQQPGQKLLDDMATTQRQIDARHVHIEELEVEMADVKRRFDADLALYRKLRGG